MAEEIDELAGVEAFAPRDPGDPDDPFNKAFANAHRGMPTPEETSSLGGAALVLAVIVCVAGLLAVLFGIPDDDGSDDGSDDVAASLDQTTSTSGGGTSSTTVVATTSTAGLTPGSGAPATSTTIGRTTLTTVRPSTTLPQATTTTAFVNRPLVIEIRLSDDTPAVDQQITVTVTISDDDAEPTVNCQVIEVDGEELFPDDPCTTTCGGDGSGADPVIREREVDFNYTFTSEGPHTIEVEANSGNPECNPYASADSESLPVNVLPA